MTNRTSGWNGARFALIGAAVLATGAVAFAVIRNEPGAAPASEAAATTPAAPTAPDPDSIIRALQDRVGLNPRDADAWSKLAEAYFLSQRYDDATRAYRRAAGLAPERAGLWSAYGEAAVMASPRDPMPAEALVAFTKARELDRQDPRARYFLGVARDLKGDHAGAIADWLALLADTPAGAPWEADLRRTIEQVGKINNIDIAARLAAVKQPVPAVTGPAPGMGDPAVTGAIPGPTREQMQAATALPKGAQDQMVAGMVSSLESKLNADPDNVDGWLMLMRSRVTLGETAKAIAARDAAIAANPADAARIRNAAATLGLPAR